MKPTPPLNAPVQFFTAVIVLLGMLGGCLIVAHSGFGTSPKHGGPSVFVPAPQAYLMAATMFGMSLIGMLALLRARQLSKPAVALAAVAYCAVAVAFTGYLSQP